MASLSDRTVTESIRDDFLTCHICFEVFTDPRILSCLHTYCFQCICSHVDTTQAEGRPVVCPECREPISESVSSLKTNFFINGLTEVVKEKSAERIPCTICHLLGTDSTAKDKCLDCGDYLCSTCSAGHNASSITSKHKKIPLDDIKQGKYDDKLRQLQKIKCPKHEDKYVEIYCDNCSKSICLTCVVLHHRDHRCKTISEAVSEKKSSIGDLTEKLRQDLKIFNTEEKKVASELKLLTQAEKRERMKVELEAKEQIERINDKKETALKKIAKETKTVLKEYEGQLEDIRVQKSLVSSCVNFSDNILKKGKDDEVLMLEAMVTERLVYLQKYKEGCQVVENRESFSGESVPDKNVPQSETATYASKLSTPNQDTNAMSDGAGIGSRRQGSSNAGANQSSKKSASLETNIAKLRLQNIMSAKFPSDSKNPGIKGMAYSSKLGIILSDNNNGTIKIMNKAGTSRREISPSGFHPHAVAVAGDIIGAVSENFLFLFSSKGSLKQKVTVADEKPDEDYLFTYSLAASETVGFVVGNIHGANRLVFYNLEGKFIRYLYCSIQYPLASLSITPSGYLVLSEWGCGRIRVISPEGQLQFKTRDSQWRPNGTCTSKDGTIFVANYEKGSISVYNSEGNLLFDHSTQADGINNPKYVSIDENGNLYVANYTGRIFVCKVVKQGK